MEERKQTFDFYDQTYFKTYNLDKAIQEIHNKSNKKKS